MEILNKNVALLSNYEVYDLLKRIKEEQTHKLLRKKKLDPNNAAVNVDKHLPTVVYESLKYLERSVFGSTGTDQQQPQVSQTVVAEFLSKLDEKRDEYKLTKAEKLQILNLRPCNAVELQAIVEDSEERFSIEQMDSLLEFIQKHLNSSTQQQQQTSCERHQQASNDE